MLIGSEIYVKVKVDKILKGILSANIGEVELNSLIFQDNIAKKKDARKGTKNVC